LQVVALVMTVESERVWPKRLTGEGETANSAAPLRRAAVMNNFDAQTNGPRKGERRGDHSIARSKHTDMTRQTIDVSANDVLA
jgi:hypothetical protein